MIQIVKEKEKNRILLLWRVELVSVVYHIVGVGCPGFNGRGRVMSVKAHIQVHNEGWRSRGEHKYSTLIWTAQIKEQQESVVVAITMVNGVNDCTRQRRSLSFTCWFTLLDYSIANTNTVYGYSLKQCDTFQRQARYYYSSTFIVAAAAYGFQYRTFIQKYSSLQLLGD